MAALKSLSKRLSLEKRSDLLEQNNDIQFCFTEISPMTLRPKVTLNLQRLPQRQAEAFNQHLKQKGSSRSPKAAVEVRNSVEVKVRNYPEVLYKREESLGHEIYLQRQIILNKNKLVKRTKFQNKVLEYFGKDLGSIEARPLVGKFR